MEDTPRLYDTLVRVLCKHGQWLDVRHMKTLAWMIAGLIQSERVNLTAWVPFVQGRAQYAQSTVRRFRRWLDNERIQVNALYGPLIAAALADWGQEKLYLALDTSMLWDRYCIIRLSVVYRGRAVPLIWTVLEHGSSSVAFAAYKDLLVAAEQLLPLGSRVVFLADRGFADTDLMRFLSNTLGWQWRIRIKGNFKLYRRGHRSCKIKSIGLRCGQACFWQHIWVTDQRYGPVHLAMAHHPTNHERWYVLSSEPTEPATFDEYGSRFDIEENFLDDKSNGFQLEASLIRSASALNRLCFVLALATLYLVAQGVVVVEAGLRRRVDPHWFRGSSYLKIGWNWVKHALIKGWSLTTRLRLTGIPDPEPCVASRSQFFRKPTLCFSISFKDFA
jgi:hypothetical protein